MYFVYILASGIRGTLYVGVTNNLVRRVYQHRSAVAVGFSKRYGVHQLVHFETTESILSAIQREKRIKKWPRDWKINLIERENPTWDDLYPRICNSI